MDTKPDMGAPQSPRPSVEPHRPFFGRSLKTAGAILPIILLFGFLHLLWIRLFVADLITTTVSQERNGTSVTTDTLPSSLSEVFDEPFSERRRRSEAEIPFTDVRVITTYARPALLAKTPAIDLFIFTLGLALRNLHAEFCVVGRGNGTASHWKWYAVNSSIDDVTMCVLPDGGDRLSADDIVTIVLSEDSALFRAFDEDLKLSSTRHAPRLKPTRDVTLVPKTHGLFNNEHGCNATCTMLKEWHVAVRSSVQWSPHRAERIAPQASRRHGRYATCLTAIVKTSPHLLSPWVEYHRNLGIDHVYIFDNGLPQTATTPFKHRRDVSVVTWPWQKTQAQAMSFMLVTGRVRCVHLMKIDVDEYAMIGLGSQPFAQTQYRPFDRYFETETARSGSLHTFLRPIRMSNSGFVRRPTGRGAVPELYVHRAIEQTLDNGKSVCETDVDWRAARIHTCGFERMENGEMRDEPGLRTKGYAAKMRGAYTPREIEDRGLLVHFYERSWEEWVEKWDAGTAQTVTGVYRDDHRGTLRVEEVDREYVDVSEDNGVRVKYTFFRDVFRRVVREGRETGRRCVIVREVDGEEIRTVVSTTERDV